MTAFQGSGVYASDDLWWFGGENAANYSESISLWANYYPPSYGFEWTVTAGADIVNFHNGADSFTSSITHQVGLVSTAGSASWMDVGIQVKWNGGVVGTATLAVAKGHHLVHLSNADQNDATFGYASTIRYQLQDQFNRVLGRRIEVNENWSTGTVSDFQGENWVRGDPNGVFVDAESFPDYIEGHSAPCNPAALNPGNPLGNVKVQHWGQDIFAGSLIPGKGIKVQAGTIQEYQDHARHENVTSPPP